MNNLFVIYQGLEISMYDYIMTLKTSESNQLKTNKSKQNKIIRTNLSKTSYFLQGTITTNDLNYNYNELWDLHPLIKEKVFIHGKFIEMPRYTQSYGSSYTFSKVKHEAVSIPKLLEPFIKWANDIIGPMFNDCVFNTLFVNWYQNGLSYIGSHSDDEKTHNPNTPIISISLGETRKFRIKTKSKQQVMDLDMNDQTYIIMCGNMQKEFMHEVPKITGKLGASIGSRINITIRSFIQT